MPFVLDREGCLELPRDVGGDRLSFLALDSFPGPGTVHGPRRSLPQYEFRDAWQRERAGVLQLLYAESVELIQELARVGAPEQEAAGRKVQR